MGIKLDIVKWGHSAALRIPATLLAQLGMQIGDSFEVDIAKGRLTLRPAKQKTDQQSNAAIEAMKYALRADEGMAFLQCWMEGDFDAIRKEWPDAPATVFKGAEVSKPASRSHMPDEAQLSEGQARKKFAAYFSDLKASMEKEGGKVSKAEEWERCIEHWISEGCAPAEAKTWKCPRSIEAELKK